LLEQYLNPANPISGAIVYILLIVFSIWFFILICSAKALFSKKNSLSACKNVSVLRETILSAHKLRRSRELPPADSSDKSSENAFQTYLKSKFLPESGAITDHLRAIYEAGYYETRLDAGELLRQTGQSIFAWNIFLRSMLGTFIVLGLLGTLVGLANSMIHFSEPLRSGAGAWSNENIRFSIANLLAQLEGAFSPSIIGVALTIVGVFFYTFYLRFCISPLQHLLGYLTVHVWIPQLIPTTPQRLLETLTRSEEQMTRSFHAAEKVAEFAREIQDESGEFNTNLKSSNKVFRQLIGVGETLSHFAGKFREGTENLAAFQDELRSIYCETLANSETIRNNVNTALKETQIFNATSSAILQEQGEQLKTIASSLSSYETAYITQRQQIDLSLQKLLESVSSILEQIGSKNQELIEKFGNPLIEKLHQELSSVENTLRVQLSAIHGQFVRLDAPMNDAATKVAGAIEAVDKRTTSLKEDLQRLFVRREEDVDKQLIAINGLCAKFGELLAKLTAPAQKHSEILENLAQSMDKLQEAIKSRTGKHIMSPPQGIQNTKHDNKRQPGESDDPGLSIVALFSQMNTAVQNQSEIMRDLSQSINKLHEAIRQADFGKNGFSPEREKQKKDKIPQKKRIFVRTLTRIAGVFRHK